MTVIRSKMLMLVLECKNTGSLIPGHALLKYSRWRQVLIVRSAFSREGQHCPRRWDRVFPCILSSSSLELSELKGICVGFHLSRFACVPQRSGATMHK